MATHPIVPAAQLEVTPLRDELRLAIDTIPGLVWTALPDGHIDFLNQRWLEYTGMSLEAAAGWGWQAAIHPDDQPGLLAYWRSMLAAGTPGEIEARLRRVDGEFRWFLFRGVPLYDELGVLLKWYGQTTDIEDRKRAETLLETEKRLLELVARGAPLEEVFRDLCRFVERREQGSSCAILLLDRDTGRLRAVAPSIPPEYLREAHSRPASTCAGPCGRAAHLNEQVVVADIAADPAWDTYGWRSLALAFGFRACWSTPIRSSNGAVLGVYSLYFARVGVPSAEQHGLIEQFAALASIAIERDERQSSLRRSEAHLAGAQRLSLTGSYSWRLSDGELYWSEETYRIYEIEPHVKPSLELARSRVHPEDRGLFEQTAARARNEGIDFSFEHRLLLPHGGVKHLQIVAHAVRGASGELLEYTGAVRDVTELKVREAALNRVRAELAHVSRAATVGHLTVSIAHEVNQPLSGILTNASVCVRLLTAGEPDIQGAIEAARRTTRDANRAAEVIARLRALFRKKGLAREPFNLNDAVAEVIALAGSEVARSKTAVRAELAPEVPVVNGDRTQIQQVVLNLALNALEAMSDVEPSRRVLVFQTSSETAAEVAVTVRDTGVGLADLELDRLFDAFYTTKEGGMGMGLSISRSIVENHEGRLWAFPNEGGGAAFRFTLPRVPAP